MSLIKVRLTYKDFLLFPDTGKRHELIDGDHFMIPVPSVRHQAISRNIGFSFENYFRKTKKGSIFFAPIDVYLSDYDIVEPDIIIISLENNSIIQEKYINGPPDIVIEILSPSTKENDCSLKKHLYEKYQIPEYWIVNPFINQIIQFILRDGEYTRAGTGTHSISSHQFPGLTIDLNEVFL